MTRIASAVVLISLAPTATAACVVLDAERDSLSPADQKSATVLLEDTLSDTGKAVVPAPCDDVWTVSHAKLGGMTTARVSAMGRSEKLTVSTIDELPAAYDRLVRALIDGSPPATNADRHTVLAAEEERGRVQADSLAMLRIGWGVLPFSGHTGPNIGGGYRFELDRIGIDLAVDAVIPTDDNPFFAAQGRLSGQYFFDPVASATPYAGLGLGIGGTAMDEGGWFGITGTASLGYSFLRETSLRLFPQLDFVGPVGFNDADNWTPWVSLTLGVAYVPFRAQRRGR